MSSRATKQTKIDDLVDEFRVSGNQDRAFDNLAAQRLGINLTDLHCLNVIERRGSITAGELAADAGLTSGAITGVIDRLERAGYARRERHPDDRRRIGVAVTPAFYAAATGIWGPVKQDWDAALASRFTSDQLDVVIAFLRATNHITRRHMERVDGELRG
ncbi:MAG TPA: MarR family transcriptional regulator [Baekduia sp.]|nr:MarR family transcriptional regulator [Baekduia sp.]